jgi:hypothetical protein
MAEVIRSPFQKSVENCYKQKNYYNTETATKDGRLELLTSDAGPGK